MCLICWVEFEYQFSVTAREDFFVYQGDDIAELAADDVPVLGGFIVYGTRCSGN
jgi:hypothetical protein